MAAIPMPDRGIIFSAPMIRALFAGRKTMTRRLADRKIKDPADSLLTISVRSFWRKTAVGDRLWVRESWGHDAPDLDICRRGVESDGISYGPYYMADANWFDNHTIKSRPSIHMPRWASRLTLTITGVRIEPLRAITPADAIAEGIAPTAHSHTIDCDTPNPVHAFRDLWDSLHGIGAWDANPQVVALSFTVARRNIDA